MNKVNILTDSAKRFWQSQNAYPEYNANIQLRRLYELNYLVPKLQDINSLIDLGCGSGSLIRCLRELTPIKQYEAFDLSPQLIKKLDGLSDVNTTICDFSKDIIKIFPTTDVAICTGVLNYLFSDRLVLKFLERIQASILYFRVICSDKEEIINHYSKDLNANYASIYRTLDGQIKLLRDKYIINEDPERIYPDELESKYGTKQYYIKCKK